MAMPPPLEVGCMSTGSKKSAVCVSLTKCVVVKVWKRASCSRRYNGYAITFGSGCGWNTASQQRKLCVLQSTQCTLQGTEHEHVPSTGLNTTLNGQFPSSFACKAPCLERRRLVLSKH
jgi:hypothetical protein